MSVKRFFVISFLICSLSHAQNSKGSVTNVVNSKIDPAIKELFVQLGVDEKIQESIDDSDKFFALKAEVKPDLVAKLKSDRTKNDDKKLTANAEASARVAKFNAFKAKAKIQYDMIKGGLKDEIEIEIATEFKKKFSDAEIKYLVSVVKFPIFKKLSLILISDKIQDPLGIPGKKAAECLKAVMNEKTPEQKKGLL